MTTYYPPSSLSTAGAVPVINEKGQVTMQKVKVTRYQPGKKPDFARDISSDEELGEGDYEEVRYVTPNQRDRRAEPPAKQSKYNKVETHEESMEDEKEGDNRYSRHRRAESSEDEEEHRRHSHRQNQSQSSSVADSRLKRLEGGGESYDARLERRRALLEEADAGIEQLPVDEQDEQKGLGEEGDEDEIEENEDEAMMRRQRLRELAKARQVDEVMAVEEDQEQEEEHSEEVSEVSEYEEYDDSEDDMAARLKPVFVRRKDRVTLQERDEMVDEEKDDDEDNHHLQEERKQVARKLVQDEVKREIQAEREAQAAVQQAAAGGLPIPAAIASLAAASASKHPGVEGNFNFGAVGLEKHIDADNITLVAMTLEDVVTDDEGTAGETDYEKWKLRELRRIKRDRDERETMLREREEIEAIHNMTEEERKAYLAANPKFVSNKAEKGKYKFLQKYYHRGAFYLDREEDVLQRNICEPTLEDHFDRTLMPKVMQVKNFGKKGRTKYTHLVDQDTTGQNAAWTADAASSTRWHQTHGGGTKPIFDRPSTSSKRKQQ